MIKRVLFTIIFIAGMLSSSVVFSEEECQCDPRDKGFFNSAADLFRFSKCAECNARIFPDPPKPRRGTEITPKNIKKKPGRGNIPQPK